ncbi:hypothetical protein [Kineosporia sp. A_224]|nr:hypothetical protein [Kineosporia sp. A_224]
MLTHEYADDWAKTVYYGRSSYWWVAGRNPQQPLPYPGFDPDLHGG